MVDFRLIDPLAMLGMLRPGVGATQRHLDDALGDVRRALDAGQAASSLAAPGLLGTAATRTPIAPVVDVGGPLARRAALTEIVPALRERGAAAARIVNVRTSALAEADPLAPPWVRGMRPTTSRGPFLSELGERFWIDTFLLQ